MNSPRITWGDKRYAGRRGSLVTTLDEIHIADIDYGTQRNDAAPWKLRMQLPGFTQERTFRTPENAAEAAERMVELFAQILAEVRADEVPE